MSAVENKGTAELVVIWDYLHRRYFPESALVKEYSLFWSKRAQKRVLASCNITKKKVLVARELQDPKYLHFLEPLLYHEMCHAVLGPMLVKNGTRIPWHGAEFRNLEKRHPSIEGLNRWVKSGGWKEAVRSSRVQWKRSPRSSGSQLPQILVRYGYVTDDAGRIIRPVENI